MKTRLSVAVATLGALACLSASVCAQERFEHRERERAAVPGYRPGLLLDQRYHHDHYYPPRGYAVPVLPAGSISIGQECNRWATTQPSAMADAQVFQRAVAACMDGRGYTVR